MYIPIISLFLIKFARGDFDYAYRVYYFNHFSIIDAYPLKRIYISVKC